MLVDGTVCLVRQRKTKEPCPGCLLHKALCLCDLIPNLDLRTRLSLVVHSKELKRTTNTGQLAVRCLKNSQIFVRGEGREALDLSGLLDEAYQPLLFYPSDDAVELTSELVASFARPVHLIVPDGNWRQASKVAIRHRELAGVPRVKISARNSSRFHLRAETSEWGMATLQAVAFAMRVIEGEDVFASLMAVYNAKLHRTLIGRGVRVDDVASGVDHS